MGIPAETVYFFRLPLMRDAAYQLQVPSDRARLHKMALEILEAMFDGPPPELKPDPWGDLKYEPHATDPVAAKLADHAHGVRAWAGDEGGSLLARELLYLRRAAEYAETLYHNDDAVSLWQRLAELAGNGAAAADALRRAGVNLGRVGRPRIAEPLFERARIAAVDAGDRRTEGMALGALAIVFRHSGRADEAEQTFEKALAIHREVGNRRCEGNELANLALLYIETRRMQEAEEAQKLALAIHREVGNRGSEAVVLGNLSIVYQGTGRLEEAEQTCKQALAISRDIGQRRTEGSILSSLAILYDQAGQEAKGEETFRQALAIHREVGDRRTEGMTLGNLAIVYRYAMRLDESETIFKQALNIHRETSNRRFEGGHTCGYALSLLALGRADAGEVWRSGAAILAEIGDTSLLEQQEADMHQACAKAGVAAFDG